MYKNLPVRIFSLFMCLQILIGSAPALSNSGPQSIIKSDSSRSRLLPPSIAQTAEILGIRQVCETIVSNKKNSSRGAEPSQQQIADKAYALRRIFEAVLQVQSTEYRLEMELEYAYDLMARQQRKTDTVNQVFNAVNFAQLATFYGLFEPYSRIDKKFTQSAIGTCIGSGLAIVIPITGIAYNKFDKVSNLHPPSFLSSVLDGKPVDGSNLPPLVMRYLDSPIPESTDEKTRKELLNELWKKHYNADMTKSETLCSIADGKSKKANVFQNRIVLLWSLKTAVQGFNRALLDLSYYLQDAEPDHNSTRSDTIAALRLGQSAGEAARLLKLEALVAELKSPDQSGISNDRRTELHLKLLETLLCGFLDLRVASDKCQQELNYQYDVVLAKMMGRRGKFLQKTYEANFIQTGTLGACAGWSYLNGYSKAGNELFIISNSIGLCLTTASLLGTHGGWRKNQCEANSLADFFDLNRNSKQGFSPLVWSFLNSPHPESKKNQSRRQFLLELWSSNKISTMDLKKAKNLDKLGNMPSCKWDTINLVKNRIALLTSLQEQLWQFDQELLDLLQKAWPERISSSEKYTNSSLGPTANDAANLLGVNGIIASMNPTHLDETTKLLICRQIMEGFLDANVNSNLISHEIVMETQIRDLMNRRKETAVQLTNVGNFYQIGILGIISDAMGLSSNSKYVLYGDRINIVSGYMIASLGLASLLEQQGGIRPGKASPSNISAAFGKQSNHVKLSPLMTRYLNSVSPASQTGLSRRKELIRYWKESKVLNVNIDRESNIEKLSAEGKAHHWWSETIKLISNRISMLYGLRAVLRSSNIGFDQLINALD